MKKILLFGAIALSLNSFGQVPNYVPTAGLDAFYSFSNNSLDESGGSNHGTVNGATLTTDRFGSSNSAYYFDGVDDNILLTSPIFSGNSNVTNMTYSYWFNADNIPIAGTYFGIINFDSYWKNKSTSYNENGFIGFGATNPSTSYGISTDPISSAPNEWVHVVITFEPNLWKIYINGQLAASETVPHTFLNYQQEIAGNSDGQTLFGSRSSVSLGSYAFFKGKLDDIGFWVRTITECEIQELYNAEIIAISNSVTQTGATLTADYVGATYQWLDCDNANAQIVGETNQSYTPTLTGNYAVEINSNGCIDTSACMLVDFTGINEINNSSVKVYPNPSSETFTLALDEYLVGSNYMIYNQLGALVKKGLISNSNQIIDVSNIANGIYNLSIEQTNLRVKLVKE